MLTESIPMFYSLIEAFDFRELMQKPLIVALIESVHQNSALFTVYKTLILFPALLIYCVLLVICFSLVTWFYPFSMINFLENGMLGIYTLITRRIHLPKHMTPLKFTPSVSFMGGGHLWMFAVGAGHYIYENFDLENVKFLASSCGTFAAVPLACGLDPLQFALKDWPKCVTHYNERLLGCMCDTKHFYYSLWNEYLPSDAHIRCSGRLFVSVTHFPSMRNEVVSQFDSREEMIWVLVASMCLPIAFILDFPVHCDKLGMCFDGGFSNDAPCLDSYTITVSGLHKEADIKPEMEVVCDNSPNTSTSMCNAASTDDTTQDRAMDPDIRKHAIHQEQEQLEQQQEQDYKVRIRAIDVIRIPSFERVRQVSGLGEHAASKCLDFNRHEWISIRKSATSDEKPAIQRNHEDVMAGQTKDRVSSGSRSRMVTRSVTVANA